MDQSNGKETNKSKLDLMHSLSESPQMASITDCNQAWRFGKSQGRGPRFEISTAGKTEYYHLWEAAFFADFDRGFSASKE